MEGMTARGRVKKIHLTSYRMGTWVVFLCGYGTWRERLVSSQKLDLEDLSEPICLNCLRIHLARKEAHGD